MTQKPKRSPIRPDFLVIIIIILAAIGLYFFFTQMQPGNELLTETELVSSINDGKIASIDIEYVGGDNYNLWHLTGKFSEGNTPHGFKGFELYLFGDRLDKVHDAVDAFNLSNPNKAIKL